MKIRSDFVTNSSSSSFIAFTIDNPALANILRGNVSYGAEVNGDVVTCESFSEDGYIGDIEYGDLARWLSDILENAEEVLIDAEAIAKIEANAERINAAIKKADIIATCVVSDGDGTGGFHTIMSDGKYTTYVIDDDNTLVDDGKTLYEAIVMYGSENPFDIVPFLDEYGTKKTGKIH